MENNAPRKKYRRITYTDRLIIEKLYNNGSTYRAIADKLGFTPAAIHYEVKRGLYDHFSGKTWEYTRKYSATIADDSAKWRSTSKGRPIKLGSNHAYAADIATRIKRGESPDAIVGSLRRANTWTVSTPTLYRYIKANYIPTVTAKDLVQPRKSRRRPKKAAKPPRGLSIERRPQAIKHRASPGHWEMDTVIGKANSSHALLVLTERKTRFEIICKLPHKTTAAVHRALTKISKQYPPGTFQTITVDNGTEFSAYESIKQFTTEVYYCHPYSSWERGSNENANRLIRRYIKKGQSIDRTTQRDCDAIAYHINRMHRKILNYSTAAEEFEAWQQTLRSNRNPVSASQ